MGCLDCLWIHLPRDACVTVGSLPIPPEKGWLRLLPAWLACPTLQFQSPPPSASPAPSSWTWSCAAQRVRWPGLVYRAGGGAGGHVAVFISEPVRTVCLALHWLAGCHGRVLTPPPYVRVHVTACSGGGVTEAFRPSTSMGRSLPRICVLVLLPTLLSPVYQRVSGSPREQLRPAVGQVCLSHCSPDASIAERGSVTIVSWGLEGWGSLDLCAKPAAPSRTW